MPMKVRYTSVNVEIIAENRNGVRKLYLSDPLGSTLALADNTQTISDRFTYWPYGEEASRTGTTPTPLRFVGTQGYHRDTSSRTYVRARHYRQDMGRWVARDPVWRRGRASYRYAAANPETQVDATGLLPGLAPGCKEAENVNATIKLACNAIATCNQVKCLSSGYQTCIRRWCTGGHTVHCGGRLCVEGEQDPKVKCMKGVSGSDCDVTVCTRVVCKPQCAIQGANCVMLIAVVIIHEAMHCCNMTDRDHTGRYHTNPAEDVARGCFGLPGHLPEYDSM